MTACEHLSLALEPIESGDATLASVPALSNFVRLRSNYFVPVAPVLVVPVPVVSVLPPRRVSRRSWRPVRRVSRRSWRPVRRALRRSIPVVWASASDTVSTVAGIAKPNAAVSPRRENAVRREISSDLFISVIFFQAFVDLPTCHHWQFFAGKIDVDQRMSPFMVGIIKLIGTTQISVVPTGDDHGRQRKPLSPERNVDTGF